MDRAERLADLLAVLLHTPRPLRAAEIVAEVPGYPDDPESARVQFERDKATLREEGVAVEEVDGAYRVDPRGFELPDLGLTGDEAVALNLAVSLVRLEGRDPTAAMWKLGLSPDASPPLVELPATDALAPLQQAVASRATASFRYLGVERVVEPYGLLTRDGWWYVTGFDRTRGEPRNFRLDRIESDVVVGAPGEVRVPDGFDVEAALPSDAFELSPGEGVEARVLVDAVVAARVVGEVGAHRAEWRDDGAAVVRLRVTHIPGFLSWLFGLLDHATVLDPPELVEVVVARLEAIAR